MPSFLGWEINNMRTCPCGASLEHRHQLATHCISCPYTKSIERNGYIKNLKKNQAAYREMLRARASSYALRFRDQKNKADRGGGLTPESSK